jgi:glycosyltransferase involved in cell wall biosynthesis
VQRILFIIPDLEYGGAASQLRLLATGLPRSRFEPRVVVLGRPGPVAVALRAGGVEVEALGWGRRLDVRPLLALRRRVADFRPDVVHAWQPAAAYPAALCRGRARLLASAALGRGKAGVLRTRLDRWLCGRADRLVVGGEAEAQRYRRRGVPEDKLAVVPPGVAEADGRANAVVPDALDVPPSAPVIACVGRLSEHAGHRDAVWAFDILKYLYNDLHLLLVGDGPGRGRLEQFTRDVGAADQVRFLGPRADVAAVLARADVVWLPARAGGVNVALEAMAAGRPVVATRGPLVAEAVADGATGFLVPPGDKAALARQTRLLLDDPDRRLTMGAAGRRRAATTFAAAAMVERFAELYEALAQ